MSEVFIYCDDASHAKRVPVDTFITGPGGGWVESSRRAKRRESGAVRLDAGNSPTDTLRGTRSRFTLLCDKCKNRNLVARSENLFPVLDKLVAHGVSEASLSRIAAMLTLQSKSD